MPKIRLVNPSRPKRRRSVRVRRRKAARVLHAGGGHMARRKRNKNPRRRHRTHRRRRSYTHRSRNPIALFGAPRRRRRRHHRRHNRMANRRRRNPGVMSELRGGSLLPGVVGGAAGFFGSRFIPQNLPMLSSYNNGIMGYGLNAATGLAISWALSKFWNKAAGMGALIGTGVAVIARIVVDQSAAPSSAQAPAAQAAAMSGFGSDMDFDMGYYVSDGFPFPQGSAGGPYGMFPGTPFAGAPPQLATSASAVRAGVMAAAAAMPAAGGGPGNSTDRWSNNWA